MRRMIRATLWPYQYRWRQWRRPTPLPTGPMSLAPLRGPATAAGVVEAADAILAPFDPDNRLVSIVSDSNISPEGTARAWDLFYDLPRRSVQVNVVVGPVGGQEEVDAPPLQAILRETPFLRPLPDEAHARRVAASLRMTFEQFEARRLEMAMADRHPALPRPFRDSPEAVAELAAAGIDFVSGPTDITLSTSRKKNGDVVWEAQAGSQRRDVPFAATAAPPPPSLTSHSSEGARPRD